MTRRAAVELRTRLREGVDGVFIKLGSTETLELLSQHFDFGIVDLEHSPLSERDAVELLHHARALGFPAVVRLPAVDSGSINRLLEAGAVGIQISNVRRTSEVRDARAAIEFPPDGRRSVSTAHSGAGFGAMSLQEYVHGSAGSLLVAQIEDAGTDDPLEDILAAGVDVAFIGTTDLTVATGFDGEALDRRVSEIADAAAAVGVVLGGFALRREGVRYRVSDSDISLLAKGIAAARDGGGAAGTTAYAANWAELPAEQVRPGVVRRGFGASACLLVMNTCEPGMETRPHSHDFDQFALIVSGHGRYHVGDVAHEVGPGSVMLIPAGVTHFMETTDEVVENLDVFAPAREDYLHLIEWMQDAKPEAGS